MIDKILALNPACNLKPAEQKLIDKVNKTLIKDTLKLRSYGLVNFEELMSYKNSGR